ncbi:MAG: hypothetical protein LBV00_04200 [Propionibacteriaceae bacterium]|jgi:hypothetical protein|nr:hypothetical protein [Propionibacteriaceae bacterium]
MINHVPPSEHWDGRSSTPISSNASGSAAPPSTNPSGASAATSHTSSAGATSLGAGAFTVGTDIAPGRHVITAAEGQSGNFTICIAELPLANKILGGDLGVPTITATLVNGQTIHIGGISSVTFT